MKDREELEEELKIYKDRLERAMDGGNLAWWEMELPSGEIRFNDRKAKMLGYSPERFEHYSDFTELLHPEDHDKAMNAMRDHLEGRKERYEVEYRIEKKDGDYKWFRDIGAITEQDGEYKKVTGVVIDIDDRKEVEERENFLHSLLRHDIRNKIQVIKGYHQLLKKDEDLTDKGNEYVDNAEKAVRNSIDLIEKIRTLRHAEEEEIKEVNLISVIKESAKNLEGQLRELELDLQIEDFEELNVKAGSLLKEVFSNLIENSVKYSEGDKIRVSVKEKDEEIICIIEDDGKGISEDEKEKIFDKGYTTDKDRGTGLGLFLVKNLLEIYDGSVEVKDSELGGARFDIHLNRV